MLAILGPILALITQVAPALTSSGAILNAINIVTQAAPLVIETARDLIPPLKMAISAIKGNSLTTAEQLDELDKQEAIIDAAYDAASKAAKEEDEAAGDK